MFLSQVCPRDGIDHDQEHKSEQHTVAWTYLAQKHGSVVAPLIAHAMSNGVGMAVLFSPWPALVASSVLLLVFQGQVRTTLAEFFGDLRSDLDAKALGQGITVLVIVLIGALAGLSLIGRIATIAALGIGCLMISIFAFVKTRKAAV